MDTLEWLDLQSLLRVYNLMLFSLALSFLYSLSLILLHFVSVLSFGRCHFLYVLQHGYCSLFCAGIALVLLKIDRRIVIDH